MADIVERHPANPDMVERSRVAFLEVLGTSASGIVIGTTLEQQGLIPPGSASYAAGASAFFLELGLSRLLHEPNPDHGLWSGFSTVAKLAGSVGLASGVGAEFHPQLQQLASQIAEGSAVLFQQGNHVTETIATAIPRATATPLALSDMIATVDAANRTSAVATQQAELAEQTAREAGTNLLACVSGVIGAAILGLGVAMRGINRLPSVHLPAIQKPGKPKSHK